MTIGLRHRYARARFTRVGVVVALLAAQTSGALAQGTVPTGTYYDRAFMLAADQKCRLFHPMVARALTSAALQARGTAVRQGVTADDLAAAAGRASAKANQTACDNPDLVKVRGRVDSAFNGWARTPRMTFPGSRADWMADRYGLVQAGWRLKQTVATGQAPVTFGLVGDAGQGETLSAVVSFVGRSRPYAARIVLRDAERSSRPWIPGGRAGDLPPESLRRVVFSAGSATAGTGLLEPTRKDGQAWRFPDEAADLIAALDPRELFAVEFLFSDDSVARATFEAGDFAAGRAFVDMGSL